MSQNYLASRSSNLSSFNAIAMNYSTLTVSTLSGVSTLNVSRVITTSTIQVNSSMISLGNSTNQVYVSSLSYGNFSTSSNWVTSMTNRLSTVTIAMSANAQYQMTVSPSTTVSSIMYTSTLGQSWTTISAATGLPSATATSYTAGAVSGDGRYGALGAYGGYLYTTANSGATWTNTNPNTPAIYLPLNGSVTDIIGTSNPSVQGANAGSISYVPGIVGTRAINFANATPGGTPTQYIRGTWSGSTNATISLWFNIQSTAGFQSIFSAYQSNLYIGVSSSNMVYIDVPSGSSYQAINGPIVANNTWYNIVLIFQTNGLCSFYLNNQLIGTYTNTGIGSQATTLFSLGAYDNTITNAFNGYIDDFKIYNSAISTPPSPMVPQNWSSTALSNTGQYMIATATGAGLYMSSNFGSTWSQVTGVMLSAIWSNAQVSATGQYMLVNAQPQIVQPQLSGLTGDTTTTTVVQTTWVQNGVSWTSNASNTLFAAGYQPWVAFNNIGNASTIPYSWASLPRYPASGLSTTNISSPGPGNYTGEWLQIYSSVSLIMYSYNFACGGAFTNMARTYFIVGSTDNSTWYPIQLVTLGSNPFTSNFTIATSPPVLINSSTSQTINGGAAVSFTPTTYTTTGNAYNYFRIIANTTFGGSSFEINEWYVNFQAGGQTYSTNYGATWNNGYAVQTPTALSLSESGQYAIGANNSVPSAPVVYVTSNFLQGFSTGTSTTPTFQTPLGSGNNPVASAVSNTGQYMVILTNNVSGNNVYYSTNFGAYFAGLQLGTTLLTSCAISYDGSYITVSNATTTWTLNNNSNGFSLALGNQAGYQNQGQNAIAIGNGAGSINQTANSIILNASGSAVNAFAPGFYVAPIASYTASSSQLFALLGYGIGTGADNQVVQTGFILSNNYSRITRTTTQLLQLVGDNISSIYMGLNEIKITGNGASHWSIFGARTDNNHNYFSITNTSNNVNPGTPGTDVLTILDNGNVGIGKTNPATSLDVTGTLSINNGVGAPSSAGNFQGLQLSYVGSGASGYGQIVAINPGSTYTPLCLNPFGQGNVGIGTTNPANSLQIHGTTGSGHWLNSCMRITNGISSTDGATTNGTSIQLTNGYNAAYFNIMSYGFSSGGTSAIYINADTGVGVQLPRGNTAWGTYSDARMKINITPITSTLPDIMKLEPVSYLYETDVDNHCNITCRIGFTAQNVHSIYPHLVTKDASPSYTNKNGETFIPMTLTMTDLIPYLTKAIQEQQTVITAQQTQIDTLIQRLAAANIA